MNVWLVCYFQQNSEEWMPLAGELETSRVVGRRVGESESVTSAPSTDFDQNQTAAVLQDVARGLPAGTAKREASKCTCKLVIV